MTQQYGIYKTLLIKTLIISLNTSIFHGTPELLHGKHLGNRTWNPQMDGRKFWLKTLSTIFTHINFFTFHTIASCLQDVETWNPILDQTAQH